MVLHVQQMVMYSLLNKNQECKVYIYQEIIRLPGTVLALPDYLFATGGGDREYYPPFVGGHLTVEASSRGMGHAAGMRRRDILYTEQSVTYKGSRHSRLF